MAKTLRAGERGSAVVLAMVSMGVMLTLGLATVAFGGGQRKLAAGERTRESAFNLAEGVLNTQVFITSRKWAGSAAAAYPAQCSSSVASPTCPDPATIRSRFSAPEYATALWNTRVHDNGGTLATYYSPADAARQPTYDANGDGILWVRSQAVMGTVKRTIVTQIKAQLKPIQFPKNTLTAGYFATTNSGKKVLIDTNGSSYSSTPGQAGALAVRCSTGPRSTCLNFDAGKGQVSPPSYQTGYPTSAIVTPDELQSMRAMAEANGTYYASGCPAGLSGTMVFIESANCSYSTGTFNSLSNSGVVVVASGSLTFAGNATYYGLVYAANLQNSSDFVVRLQGCAKVIGSVAVEGQGGVQAGSCGTNIAFNPNVTWLPRGFGDPAPVRSTWREVAE